MAVQTGVENERGTKVVVATSVMLSFISFWRAAAIVLNDLGSSAFYAGGIAEQAIGRAAPWFILSVMLFSSAVRAVYVESCAMFTRGGVYRVVKEALGGTLAKISVSALMFDYILTGPISGVSAGQYVIGLVVQITSYLGHPWHPSKHTINLLAALIAIAVTLYFWRRNTKGIHESSDDALRIMYVTSIMIVMMILWSGVTILSDPGKRRAPPSPLPHHISFNNDAVGWMPRLAPEKFEQIPSDEPASSGVPSQMETHYRIVPDAGALFGLIGILIAFGHSVLAMSGEESLAQINRELEYPKHQNLMRAGIVIFFYSLLFTSLVSFFAYAIIPDDVRPRYFDNLLSGIAMNLIGPLTMKLLFQAFIVVVGFLMLSGAVNTAIIGSNGVLNRVSEDGVLTDWFRAPHRRYGTSYRIINLIMIFQVATIVASRGNVYVLGEAYAFGVIWSFTLNSISMLVLRFKYRAAREWKVPLNPKIGGKEIPLGLGTVTVLLLAIATINLITKQVATISGLIFTGVFYGLFWVSEWVNEKRRGTAAHEGVDQFRLNLQESVSTETLQVRPGNTICPVRDYRTLNHLQKALELIDTNEKDLVVLTVHVARGPNTGYEGIDEAHLFTNYEQLLFTRVVALAEKAGKHVHLLVVPSTNIFDAVARTAVQLDSAEIIAGRSSVMTAEEQAKRSGQAWERLPVKPKRQVAFLVVEPDGRIKTFHLGAHAPDLTSEDINRIHQLWLDVTRDLDSKSVHHRDIVTIALAELEHELNSEERKKLIQRIAALARSRRERRSA